MRPYINMTPITSEPALEDFQPRDKASQHLLAAWKIVRGNRLVPFWRDFDPVDYADAVRQSLFLKRVSDDNWPILLFGSDIVARFGTDATNLNALDVVAPSEREATKQRFRRMVETPAIFRSTNELRTANDVPLVVEWLSLPFANDNGDVAYCLLNIAPLANVSLSQRSITESTGRRKILERDFVDLTKSQSQTAQ